MRVCMYVQREKRQTGRQMERGERQNENVGSVLTGLGERSLSGDW